MKNYARFLLSISGCVAVMLVPVTQAASLEGVVTYRSSGVSAAQVSLYQIGADRKSVTVTNGAGAYALKNLPSGSYIIFVEKDGRRIYQGRVEVPERANKFDVRL